MVALRSPHGILLLLLPVVVSSAHVRHLRVQTGRAALAGHTQAVVAKQQQQQGAGKIDIDLGAKLSSEPRVFFLFMALTGLNRMDLWEAFFAGTDQRRWRALLHCKNYDLCGLELSMNNPFGLKLVDTVPSRYCQDLVSPMVQLLKAATSESTSPADKFIFISDSTLPVKPFGTMFEALTSNRDSDFCIRPSQEWGSFHTEKSDSKGALATGKVVKVSQWAVLSKDHANAMIQRWPAVKMFRKPPMIDGSAPGGATDFAKVPNSMNLCADEWATFAAIYGVIASEGKSVNLPGLNAGPLWLSGSNAALIQGVCRTFDVWKGKEDEDPNISSAFDQITSDFPASQLTCAKTGCDGSHPMAFEAISDFGLRVLRQSPFLFARKFRLDTVTREQFSRVVLTPPQAASATDQ